MIGELVGSELRRCVLQQRCRVQQICACQRLYKIVDAEGRVQEETLRTMQSALMHPIKECHRCEDFKKKGMNEWLEAFEGG